MCISVRVSDEITTIEDNQSWWIEPFRNFVKTAQSLDKIAKTGSALEKKEVAYDIFGSNLTLDRKKARGLALKPWNLLPKNANTLRLEPMSGIEPETSSLPMTCSTN